MRRWLNWETSNQTEWELVRGFLKSNHIYYEVSGIGASVHVEVHVNDAETEAINNFMDENL